MHINYDFGDLEAFLAVFDTGSFHLAAQQLSLSQSAITRRIQKLEGELDTELFERTTRAVKPTLAAKRLQPRAEAILHDTQEMTLAIIDESVSMAFQRNALITMAVVPSVISHVMPGAIQQFRDAGFAARIRLLEYAANEVAEAVSQGDADFGLCSIPALEPSTQFEHLFDDPIGIAVLSSDVLAKKSELHWAELEAVDLILPARGTGNRLLIDEAAAKLRVRLQWVFEVKRSTTALELVACGCGIALLPRSSVEYSPQSKVIYRALAEPEISRPVGLLTRTAQQHAPAVSALMEAIRAQLI